MDPTSRTRGWMIACRVDFETGAGLARWFEEHGIDIKYASELLMFPVRSFILTNDVRPVPRADALKYLKSRRLLPHTRNLMPDELAGALDALPDDIAEVLDEQVSSGTGPKDGHVKDSDFEVPEEAEKTA